MGIKGLGKFLSENAPGAVRPMEMGTLMGRILAVDASLSLYQFMIAIRDGENFGNLTNEVGDVTSHIAGFLSRVVKLLENGIKPVYVFDGKPTELKSGELAKRSERRQKAQTDLADAQEMGDKEEIKKMMGRTVRITKQHNDDVKELLRLMGVPIIESPSEAEAQCAQMAKDGLVFATATEDADALTFGSPILIRHLNFTKEKEKGKGKPIIEIQLDTALRELDLSMDQFIDFCILCGCDYCDRIKGVGPSVAYKLIKKHNTIEKALESLDKAQKTCIPETATYQAARSFFQSPEVLASDSIPKFHWKEPDVAGIKQFLVEKHNFSPIRVDGYLNRLRAAKSKSSQQRLESFFGQVTVVRAPGAPKSKVQPKAGLKRKSASDNAPNKKGRSK